MRVGLAATLSVTGRRRNHPVERGDDYATPYQQTGRASVTFEVGTLHISRISSARDSLPARFSPIHPNVAGADSTTKHAAFDRKKADDTIGYQWA